MSHLNGRIYTETKDGVKYGISTNDVATVLGKSSGDVGTLCVSDSIKPFAKYKPYKLGDISGYTQAQARAIDYGIYIPYYTNIKDMVLDIKAGTWTRAANYDALKQPWTWVYGKLGKIDEHTVDGWARLLDFDGYNHKSMPAIGPVKVQSTTIPLGVNPDFRVPHTKPQGQLTLADLIPTAVGKDPGQMFFGLMVTCTNPLDSYDRTSYLINKNVTSADASGEEMQYQDAFAINRGYYRAMNTVKAITFMSSVYGSSSSLPTISHNLKHTGFFIPIIPSLNPESLNLDLEAYNATSDYDHTTMFTPYGDYDIISVFSVKPNYSCRLKLGINIQQTSGNYWNLLNTGYFDVPIYSVWDDDGEQIPIYVRLQTNVAQGTVNVKVINGLVTEGDYYTYEDIISLKHNGESITSFDADQNVSIISGVVTWKYIGETEDNVGYYTTKYPVTINGGPYYQSEGDIVMFNTTYYVWYLGEWLNISNVFIQPDNPYTFLLDGNIGMIQMSGSTPDAGIGNKDAGWLTYSVTMTP